MAKFACFILLLFLVLSAGAEFVESGRAAKIKLQKGIEAANPKLRKLLDFDPNGSSSEPPADPDQCPSTECTKKNDPACGDNCNCDLDVKFCLSE